jgi:hypothetical protein
MRVAGAVVRPRRAVHGRGAPELGGHQHHDVVQQAAEVGREGGERLAERPVVVDVVLELVRVGVEAAADVDVDAARADSRS